MMVITRVRASRVPAGYTAYPETPTGRCRRRKVSRRGVAVLLVVLLLAITLGLSYAAVRSQHTALQIQSNAERLGLARQAAVSGLAIAFRRVHTSAWGGVGTAISGVLGDYESYEVQFIAGDPRLGPGHPEYDDYPYRITLLATGRAVDPFNQHCVSTHKIRAVLRLNPRALSTVPTDWSVMQQYTVYQTNRDDVRLEIPSRLEGRLRFQKKLKLADQYPDDENAWIRYLSDLNAMRKAGLPDYRPLTGSVHLRLGDQDAKILSGLLFALVVSVIDTPPSSTAADWIQPTALSTYRIYSGGPLYAIPALSDTLEGTQLVADPINNPLGIYYRDGTLTARDNVTVRGSVFCRDDLRVEGAGMRLEPVSLPPLHGSTAPIRLPTAVCRNLLLRPKSSGTVTGLVAAFGDLNVEKAWETQSWAFVGRAICQRLNLLERQPWDTINWKAAYDQFMKQVGSPTGIKYFPQWLAAQGRDPQPRITIKPDQTTFRYHWHNPGSPIFVPHPDDPGLRWDLIDWTEGSH